MSTQPADVHSIWDNGGDTQDRYTVALKNADGHGYHDCLACPSSDNLRHMAV
jgi:hypothetical protein